MGRSIQRFEILEQLGAGAAGVVYRARDPQLERDVAIKVLHTALDGARSGLSTERTLDLRGGDAANTSDLLAEARVMARLSHPNVLPVYEVGLDGDALFIVMELVDGADLRAWLATPRAVADVLGVFAQTARGLAAAHDQGIIHRDLKPDNILIGRDGRVRVADFGLSRIVAAGAAFVRTADTAGTPRYMAPELWHGAPADQAADVFAFCTALTEALGGEPASAPEAITAGLRARGVPARVCAAIAAGRSPSPVARPAIRQVLAALEPRPHVRARVAVAVVGTAAAVVGLAVVAVTGSPRPAAPVCRGEPALLAGRWDIATRVQLLGKLATALPPVADSEAAAVAPPVMSIDEVLAATGGIARQIGDAARQACDALARGELTAHQAGQRASCVERRAMELGAGVRALLAAPEIHPLHYEELLLSVSPETCQGLELPELGDRARVEANYRDFARMRWLSRPLQLAELGRIAGAAAAVGDAELETRARMWLGQLLHGSDRIADGTRELDVSYRRASEIKHVGLEAIALASRTAAEITAGNARGAEGFARLARELAERPSTPPVARVIVYRALGRAEMVRGDFPAAAATLGTGLDLLQQQALRASKIEIPIRMDLVDTLVRIGGRERDALTLARQTAARARVLLGAHELNTAVALNQVAEAYRANAMPDREMPYRREALAIVEKLYPPEHSQVLHARGQLARALLHLGRAEEARAELEAVVAIAERHPGMGGEIMYSLADLGHAAYAAGRHAEGIAWLERALESATSHLGEDHQKSLATRFELAELHIDSGQLAAAAQQITALERICGPAASDACGLARVRGELVAEIERARHRPARAEALAQGALDELARTRAQPAERHATLRVLGAALVDQRRYSAAVPQLQAALAAARDGHAPDDSVAIIELELARAELGLGDAAAAAQRVGRIRDTLERLAGHRRATRELEVLRDRLARSSSFGAGAAPDQSSASPALEAGRRP